MKYITLMSFGWFLVYSLTSIGLLALFTLVYHKITPYHEFDEMRKGNSAPAIAKGGAMLGYTMCLAAASFVGVNFWDFLIWAGVVGLVQIALVKVLYKVIPMDIEEDNCS